MSSERTYGAQAQRYASLGLRVLPVTPGKKSPPLLTHWPEEASADPQTVAGWWRGTPGANIAVVMGGGLVDVESDKKGAVSGEDSLAEWADSPAGCELPHTWAFESGSGGIHRLYRSPALGNRTDVLPAVDVRGAGGYAVFPPSLHPNGKRYKWLPGCSPEDMPDGPADLPFELFCLITESGAGQGHSFEVPAEIPEGSRNDTMFRWACKLRRGGLSGEALLAALRVENERLCPVPLDDSELELICRQAARYEAGELPKGLAASVGHMEAVSAQALQEADLPPVRFLVADMLPEGTGMVSAASKIGKSWLVLKMGLAIAAGTPFLQRRTSQCGVLYLALEDSLKRLQDRMNKVLDDKRAPAQFYFVTEAPTLDTGLLEAVEAHITQHPETKLVIIDTLQKIRGQALQRENSYAQDYREMGVVKDFMAKLGVSVFFVHHNRKMRDDDDPFNMISGTNGIMGAADTSWVITKDKRADDTATLHITGRDIPQTSTVIRFSKDAWAWEVVGDADWLAEQQARSDYESSPIVLTIKTLLGQSPDGRWTGTAKELLEAGKEIARTYIAETAQKLGYELKHLDRPLFDYDEIIHSTLPNGNAGKKHYFFRQTIPEDYSALM